MFRVGFVLAGVLAVCGAAVQCARAQDPWADEVVAYEPGNGAVPGYDDTGVVLGAPARFTGETGGWPGAVTPFNAPWEPDEILSLGAGGSLTVRFDPPITDDPAHRFGVDFIIFANGFFADASYPDGVVGGAFEHGPFSVSVSADGEVFVPLGSDFTDALFPTLGYLDLDGPYATVPGDTPSDFTRPVNPALSLDDFMGLSFPELLALYDGSGGGIPCDLAGTGLEAVHYVRVELNAGATALGLDAFAAVPEPASIGLALVAWWLLVARRGRR